MSGRITKKIYVKGNLILVSPLIMSGGADDITDKDLIKNGAGEYIIPGTAAAGVIRHYLKETYSGLSVDEVFGAEGDNQSMLVFYDSPIVGSAQISVRDGVAIDGKTGTVKDKSKYNYQILEAGNSFTFRIGLTLRENSSGAEDVMDHLIHALQKEEIYFGAKTSRGFGKVRLDEVKTLSLDFSDGANAENWINFSWDKVSGKYTINSDIKNSGIYTSITAGFKIASSLLIRSYSKNPEDADSYHLHSSDKPVIPGTSWAGVLRHCVENILEELDYKKPDILKDLFGFVDQKTKEAKPSRIIIEESIIESAMDMRYTRNKIDRFTGGTVDTALFDEQAVYGGTTALAIRIKNAQDYEIGLILLALKDISNGIQPVGGDSNIGRGILEGSGKTKIDEKDVDDNQEKACYESLYKKINEGVTV